MVVNQDDSSPDETTDPREQAFHNMVRENVIFLIILILLYGFSYLLISSYRKRRDEVIIKATNDSLNFTGKSR